MTWIKRVSAGVASAFRFGRITEPAVATCRLLRVAGTAERLKVRRVEKQGLIATPGLYVIDHACPLAARDADAIIL
jgi:hypothetical protein